MPKVELITSREYKVIIDGVLFAPVAHGLRTVHDDIDGLARSIGLKLDGKFDVEEAKDRTIVFLDTSDFSLHLNGLLLRQRVKPKNGKTEYTLKLRTEDRYIAAGADLKAAPDFDVDTKFEEDVGVPFVSRFSRSTTIALEGDDKFAGKSLPKSLAAAAKLFPCLLDVRRDGLRCKPKTPLVPVNGLSAFEQVYKGPVLELAKKRKRTPASSATAAIIVWSTKAGGRILTAEFSFRYEDKGEEFPAEIAAAARRFFEGVQRRDWSRPDALTKTQFFYSGR